MPGGFYGDRIRRDLWNAIVATVLWFIRSFTTVKVSSGDGDASSVVILSIPLSSKTAIFRECQDFLEMENGSAQLCAKVGDRPKSYETGKIHEVKMTTGQRVVVQAVGGGAERKHRANKSTLTRRCRSFSRVKKGV